MIEQLYKIERDKGNHQFNVIRFDHRVVATCRSAEDAERLCFQLNRLAALEAACREIVEDAPAYSGELSTETELKARSIQTAAEERRWRVIADDGLPQVDGFYLFAGRSGGKPVTISMFVDDSVRTTNVSYWMSSPFTHWRPLPTDLPEVE